MSCSPVLRFRIVNLILATAAFALSGASSLLAAHGEQLFKGQVIECACDGLDSAAAGTGAAKTRRWGSFMMAKPTRSLIEQLRMQLALEKQPDAQRFADKRDHKASAPPGN